MNVGAGSVECSAFSKIIYSEVNLWLGPLPSSPPTGVKRLPYVYLALELDGAE